MKTILSCLVLTPTTLFARESDCPDVSSAVVGEMPLVELEIQSLLKSIQNQEDKV